MDCDRVFMVLTRGPFPTGEPWDEEVEAHLEVCGECWRLAEALRPAQEVSQEAVSPVEGRELPGYWGDARPTAAVAAQLASGVAGLPCRAGVRPATRPELGRPLTARGPLNSPNVLAAMALGGAVTALVIGLLAWWRG
jgi:hypothetical protein